MRVGVRPHIRVPCTIAPFDYKTVQIDTPLPLIGRTRQLVQYTQTHIETAAMCSIWLRTNGYARKH